MAHVFNTFKSCILQSHTQMTVLTGIMIPRSMLIMTMNVNRSYAFREERVNSKISFFLSYSLDGRRQRYLVAFVVVLYKKIIFCFTTTSLPKKTLEALKGTFLLNYYTNNR